MKRESSQLVRSAEDEVLCRGAGCPRQLLYLAAAGGERKKMRIVTTKTYYPNKSK
jgi:hypothetical protein